MSNRRKIMMVRGSAAKESILPKGFVECEYLEIDKTHQLYFPSYTMDSIITTYAVMNTLKTYAILCTENNSSWIGWYNGNAYVSEGGYIYERYANPTLVPLLLSEVGQNGDFYTYKTTFDKATFSNGIFYRHLPQFFTKTRQKELQFIDGVSTVFKVIPTLCLAGTIYTNGNTGKQNTATADIPGMYDIVSGKFFVNYGTGTLGYLIKGKPESEAVVST